MLLFLYGLSLVAAAPDFHFLGALNKLIAENGICTGDKRLGPLPCGFALEIYTAVLSADVHCVRSGIRYDAAV